MKNDDQIDSEKKIQFLEEFAKLNFTGIERKLLEIFFQYGNIEYTDIARILHPKVIDKNILKTKADNLRSNTAFNLFKKLRGALNDQTLEKKNVNLIVTRAFLSWSKNDNRKKNSSNYDYLKNMPDAFGNFRLLSYETKTRLKLYEGIMRKSEELGINRSKRVIIRQYCPKELEDFELSKISVERQSLLLSRLEFRRHKNIETYISNNISNYITIWEYINLGKKGYQLSKKLEHYTYNFNLEQDRKEILKLLKDCLKALMILEKHFIIKRNLSPENIFKNDKENYILTDFTQAKEERGYSSNSPLSYHIYINILRGFDLPINTKTIDLYLLGCLIIHCLTGRIASDLDFSNGNLKWHHLIRDKKIDPKLIEIIDKLVSFNWQERYQRTEEVLQDIEKLINKYN